jgi:hypothetical protein
LNFVPTWDGGKARVWLSHPPEEYTPLKTDNNGNIVPFEIRQVNNPRNISIASFDHFVNSLILLG